MSFFSWLTSKPTSAQASSRKKEESFFDEEGLVVQSILPGGKGKIRLCGVYWNAKAITVSQFPIPVGTLVSIKDRIGLTLFVEPLPASAFAAAGWEATRPSVRLGKAIEENNLGRDTAA